MSAITTRMPAGIPGDVTRKANSVLEPGIIGTSAVPYGSAIKLSGSKHVGLEAGDGAADVVGFLARPYPTRGANDTVDASAPAGAACDVLKTGYLSVELADGTASKGADVFVRVQTDTGKAVGDIEAAVDRSIAGVAGGENTGNATIGTLSVDADAKPGAYTVDFTAATAFNVYDPDGLLMRAGATGTEFSAGGVTFTITAGDTACVAGDSFTVTVTENTVAIPGAEFMGAADANGNVEIAFNL